MFIEDFQPKADQPLAGICHSGFVIWIFLGYNNNKYNIKLKNMIKLTSQLLGAIAGAFALALFITLNVYLSPVLGFWMLAVDAVLLIGGLVVASYVGDFSVPIVKTLLKREYYRVKFRQKKKGSSSAYLKFLAGLIMLFKSAEEGFEVIKEEAHDIHGKALLFVKDEKKKGKQALGELKQIHLTKQRRAATISASAVFLFIVGSLVTALFSTLIYPNIFQSQAATFTWTQTDWSGGTSTAIAEHSGGSPEQNWTNYASADSNITIDGSGNITMSSGIQDVEETTTEDFNAGNYNEDKILTESGELKRGITINGTCSFGVWHKDLEGTYLQSEGINACQSLGLSMPNLSELRCICNNKGEYGTFTTGQYWNTSECAAHTPNESTVNFSNCDDECRSPGYDYLKVRCIKR